MKKGLALLLAAVLLAGVSGCGSEGKNLVQEETESIRTEGELGGKAEEGAGTGDDAADESSAAAQAAQSGEAEAPENASEAADGDNSIVSNTEAAAEEAADAVRLAERPKVRGIYVTGPMAGTANMDELIGLVGRTELNAMVIDIKNDEGYVTCDMDAALVQEVGSVKRYIRDVPALVQKCKEKDIYLIARIVAFRDPLLAEAKPEWSLHNADGTVFRDKSGLAWVNPYEKEVWDYLAEVAEGAIDLGFDEVQFDYIRFSTDSGMKNVDFGPAAEGREKTEVIAEFAAYAAQRIHEKGAAVSADVYGIVIDSAVDQQIVGQDYLALAEHLDYLSPMVYPSHYGPYNYNIPIPDAQPYDTVLAAMQSSKKVLAGVLVPEPEAEEEAEGTVSGNEAVESTASENEAMESAALESTASGNTAFDNAASENPVAGSTVSDNEVPDNGDAVELTAEEIAALSPLKAVRADVRPWLQDFTATWVKGHIKYGPEQIREQIQAVYDAGYEEWILWNAANRYTEGGLYGADGQPVAAKAPAEPEAQQVTGETSEEPDAHAETDGQGGT